MGGGRGRWEGRGEGMRQLGLRMRLLHMRFSYHIWSTILHSLIPRPLTTVLSLRLYAQHVLQIKVVRRPGVQLQGHHQPKHSTAFLTR